MMDAETSSVGPEGSHEESATTISWHEANRRVLYASLEVLHQRLARETSGLRGRAEDAPSASHLASTLPIAEAVLERARDLVRGQSSLDAIVSTFALSPFERDVLLLAAGPKLRPGFVSDLFGASSSEVVTPSFELAFRALPSPHWAAATPGAPLRYHHLIELDRPDDPVNSPLRIDERILFFLLGLATVDARLQGQLERAPIPDRELPAQYTRVARAITAFWSSGDEGERPVLQLCGLDQEGKRAIASIGCAGAGLSLLVLRGADAHCEPSQRVLFARLIDRELALSGAALLLDVDEDEPEESRAARALIARMHMPVIVARRGPLSGISGRVVRLDVEPLSPDDQRRLWRASVGQALDREPQVLDEIVGHFRLGPAAIRASATALAASDVANAESETAGARLWDICRHSGRSHISELAQRIESEAGWDDLILPAGRKEVLAQIASHLVHKTKVYERWGFAARGGRGLGLTALFYGDSGTGKTLAAEVIANEVKLDLWRVDLSRVLDKYIGETEKNLRKVFDAAEESGAILLFDEADALFSKRTDVKDSVDRFANVEVSYLLQRMESYGGLAILTTNMYASLDTAFMRRLRFVVQFPFPRAEQRALIWQRAFPSGAPMSGVSLARLAQLNLAGGNIRNIALNAAFLAAADGGAITMAHLLRASRSECEKLERHLADAEIAGWT